MEIKVSLTVIEGEDRGRTITIEAKQTVIGRSRGDVLIDDKKISGEHMALIIEKGKLYLEDLASTNGTLLNDEPVEAKVEIKNLDEIAAGFTKLRVAIVDSLENFQKRNQATKEKKPKQSKGLDIGKLIDDELKRFSRWDIIKPDSLPSFTKKLQAPKVPMSLEVIEGPDKGKVISLNKGNLTLGRGKVDVKIRDVDISRSHASIEIFSEEQVFLRDLASTNGTFINKKRISYSKLSEGDLIQIGETVLRFNIDAKEEKAP